jgi:hypothetical protein
MFEAEVCSRQFSRAQLKANLLFDGMNWSTGTEGDNRQLGPFPLSLHHSSFSLAEIRNSLYAIGRWSSLGHLSAMCIDFASLLQLLDFHRKQHRHLFQDVLT